MNTALERARAGDGTAFGELTDPFVSELRLHCYRMLGSLPDAEDMVQETLLSAWRRLAGFEERAVGGGRGVGCGAGLGTGADAAE